MAEKFTLSEKADLATAVDNSIMVAQRAARSATDDAVRIAHENRVKRLQELFVKVRQNL